MMTNASTKKLLSTQRTEFSLNYFAHVFWLFHFFFLKFVSNKNEYILPVHEGLVHLILLNSNKKLKKSPKSTSNSLQWLLFVSSFKWIMKRNKLLQQQKRQGKNGGVCSCTNTIQFKFKISKAMKFDFFFLKITSILIEFRNWFCFRTFCPHEQFDFSAESDNNDLIYDPESAISNAFASSAKNMSVGIFMNQNGR